MPPTEKYNDVSQDDLSPAVVQRLVAYDEARATGNQIDVDVSPDTSASEELAGDLACVDLLYRVWPDFESPSLSHKAPLPKTLGDFRLIREIGRGGMGTVFEAEQILMGRRVALKVLPFASLVQDKSLLRFRNEVRAAAALDHPNIVSVYSVGDERGVHFYAMQLIRGQTLADMIHQLHKRSPSLRPLAQGNEKGSGVTSAGAQTIDSAASWPPSTNKGEQARASTMADSRRGAEHYRMAARIGIQAAEALQHAHDQGVLHRDIKPGNLMLDGEGKLYITDFGLARIEADAGLTMTGDVIGTLRYMAPEQALAKRVVIDHRADVYSLGATLYELLTLQPAFDETDRSELLKQIAFDEPRPLRKVDRHIPAELETIVLKSMAKVPDERYQTAQQLADDLRALLEHRPIKAKPPSTRDRASKWLRRHVSVVLAAATVLLISTAVLMISGLRVSKWYLEAENQRKLASIQLKEAQHQENLARSAQANESAARVEAETSLYISQLRLAGDELHRGQVRQLHGLLDHHLPTPGQPDLRGWEWYYYLSACHDDQLTLYGHTDSVDAVSWSPGGNRVATSSRDGRIVIWDAVTGRDLRIFSHNRGSVSSLDWSPDGSRLVSGEENGQVSIWEASSGREIRRLKFGGAPIGVFAWSPDGKHIASSSRLGGPGILIWDAESGEITHTHGGTSQCESPLAWSPDGQKLAYWRLDELAITIWDSTEEHELTWAVPGMVYALDWKPRGELLAGAVQDEVILWSATNGKINNHWRAHNGLAEDVAWNPQGDRLATAGTDHVVRIWEPKDGSEIATIRGHVGEVLDVDWSPNGEFLVSGGADCMAKIWKVNDRSSWKIYHPNDGSICRLAWSRDGKRLVSASDNDNIISIWSPDNDRDKVTLRPPAGHVGEIALSPDGGQLATTTGEANIQIWDMATGHEVRTLEGHARRVDFIAWSSDGTSLAAVGSDGIYIWDVMSGRELAKGASRDACPSIAWSPTNDRLLYACHGKLQILKPSLTENPQLLPIPRCDSLNLRVETIGWNFDGSRLAARVGSLVWIADGTTGQPIAYLRGHIGEVYSAVWSPDGKRLASVDSKQTIIWDTATGQMLVRLEDFPGDQRCVTWSPDGKQLAVGGANGTVAILDATKGYALAESDEYQFDLAHRLAAIDSTDEAIRVLQLLASEHPEVEEYSRALATMSESAHRVRTNEYGTSGANDQAVPKLDQEIEVDPTHIWAVEKSNYLRPHADALLRAISLTDEK